MTRPFFGEYLVEQGVVSDGDLERAVALQKQNNKLLGQLAEKSGFLSRQQVFDVLYQQRKTRRRFGRIAVDLGLLSREQVLELLSVQADNHMFLGEAMVRLGFVDGSRMNELVNEFGRMTLSVDKAVGQVLDPLTGPRHMVQVLEVVRDGLFQLGFTTKPTLLESQVKLDGALSTNLFMAECRGENESFAFGITGSDRMLDMLARLALEELEQEQTYRLYSVMTDLVAQLGGVLCDRLESGGIRMRPGMIKNALLPHRRGWTARLRTMPECFLVVYLEQ